MTTTHTARRGALRGSTRILLWFMSTLTVLVLLLGYRTSLAGPGQLSASAVAPIVSGTTSSSTTGTTSSGAGAPGPGSSGSTGTSGSADTSARTVTGPAVDTRYGPVQVELSVTGSGASATITGVSVLQYPHNDGHDAQINGYALPILVQETMDAQGSGIDMVSGATYTSAGYQSSLQAALDEARA